MKRCQRRQAGFWDWLRADPADVQRSFQRRCWPGLSQMTLLGCGSTGSDPYAAYDFYSLMTGTAGTDVTTRTPEKGNKFVSLTGDTWLLDGSGFVRQTVDNNSNAALCAPILTGGTLSFSLKFTVADNGLGGIGSKFTGGAFVSCNADGSQGAISRLLQDTDGSITWQLFRRSDFTQLASGSMPSISSPGTYSTNWTLTVIAGVSLRTNISGDLGLLNTSAVDTSSIPATNRMGFYNYYHPPSSFVAGFFGGANPTTFTH